MASTWMRSVVLKLRDGKLMLDGGGLAAITST